MPRTNTPLKDNDLVCDNVDTGYFETTRAFARLSTDGPGTLHGWNGDNWDAGVAFTDTTQVITGTGRWKLVLDSAGYASVHEPVIV